MVQQFLFSAHTTTREVMTTQKWGVFFLKSRTLSIIQKSLAEKHSHAKYRLFIVLKKIRYVLFLHTKLSYCKTSNLSIFTHSIHAIDLKFCTRSYSSYVYRMMWFKGSSGKVCKMITSHYRTLTAINFCSFTPIKVLYKTAISDTVTS